MPGILTPEDKEELFFDRLVKDGLEIKTAREVARTIAYEGAESLAEEEKRLIESVIRKWLEKYTLSLTAKEREDYYCLRLLQKGVSSPNAKKIAAKILNREIKDLAEEERILAETVSQDFVDEQMRWVQFYKKLKKLP